MSCPYYLVLILLSQLFPLSTVLVGEMFKPGLWDDLIHLLLRSFHTKLDGRVRGLAGPNILLFRRSVIDDLKYCGGKRGKLAFGGGGVDDLSLSGRRYVLRGRYQP